MTTVEHGTETFESYRLTITDDGAGSWGVDLDENKFDEFLAAMKAVK
jgi:hypothetical protein